MFVNLVRFGALGLAAVIAVKLLFGLFGLVFNLLWSVVVFAVVGFGVYLLLKALGIINSMPKPSETPEESAE